MMKYIPIAVFSAVVILNYSSLVRAEFFSDIQADESKTLVVTQVEEQEQKERSTDEEKKAPAQELATKVLGIFLNTEDNTTEKEFSQKSVQADNQQTDGANIVEEQTAITVEEDTSQQDAPPAETTSSVLEDRENDPQERKNEKVDDTESEEEHSSEDTDRSEEHNTDTSDEERDESEEETPEEELPAYTEEDVEKYTKFKESIDKLFYYRKDAETAIKNAELPFVGGLYAVARNNYAFCIADMEAARELAENLPFVHALSFTEQYRSAWITDIDQRMRYCEGYYEASKKLAAGTESLENLKSWSLESLDKLKEPIQNQWYTIQYWDGQVKEQAAERGL